MLTEGQNASTAPASSVANADRYRASSDSTAATSAARDEFEAEGAAAVTPGVTPAAVADAPGVATPGPDNGAAGGAFNVVEPTPKATGVAALDGTASVGGGVGAAVIEVGRTDVVGGGATGAGRSGAVVGRTGARLGAVF